MQRKLVVYYSVDEIYGYSVPQARGNYCNYHSIISLLCNYYAVRVVESK